MHLGTKLKLYRKAKDLDQFQMAEILNISHRKYQDIEKSGIILKSADQQAIRKVLEESTHNIAQEADPLAIISNLTESNRMLAEANLLLATKISSGESVSDPLFGRAGRKGKWDDTQELPFSDKTKPGPLKKRKGT